MCGIGKNQDALLCSIPSATYVIEDYSFICLSIHPLSSTHPSIHLSTLLSSTQPSIHLLTHLSSIHPSIHPSTHSCMVCLSIHTFIHPSTFTYTHPCGHLSHIFLSSGNISHIFQSSMIAEMQANHSGWHLFIRLAEKRCNPQI